MGPLLISPMAMQNLYLSNEGAGGLLSFCVTVVDNVLVWFFFDRVEAASMCLTKANLPRRCFQNTSNTTTWPALYGSSICVSIFWSARSAKYKVCPEIRFLSSAQV